MVRWNRNKFGAIKVKSDGYTFDSKAEANRYFELKLLQLAGEINDLVIHPSFVLYESEIVNGEKLHSIKYTADFMYKENGRSIVEDVKGVITRDASLRINIFKRLYRDYTLKIIR